MRITASLQPGKTKEEFEKRVLIWTVMRDIFGGWYNTAVYLWGKELSSSFRGNKRIKKKRIKKAMAKLVWSDLKDHGLDLTLER